MSDEISTKPYLIRAIYEWCTDNGFTPYLAVHVDGQTVVPRQYVQNNEIVLNIGALATSKLTLGNDFVDFHARFGGVARAISVPMRNVSAIYAKENGQGMAFEVNKEDVPVAPVTPAALAAPEHILEERSDRPTLSSVDAPTEPVPSHPDDGPKGKPRLTIVK